MSNHITDREPSDPWTELQAAKGKFARDMLANDAFFSAVKAKLEAEDSMDTEVLPEFGCEPTVNNNDNRFAMGVGLTSSIRIGGNSVFIHRTKFTYINIGQIDGSTGGTEPNPELIDLLTIGGVEDTRTAFESILETWRLGFDSIMQQFEGRAGVDPVTHLIELGGRMESGL
jgi:hypothetical protein